VTISEQTKQRVRQRLGRTPRGLEAIAVSDAAGDPVVIRVASLVDDKPFPTLFWLVDPDLSYRIDTVEAAGLIAQLQQRIDADPALQVSMRADHEAHIALRESLMDNAVRERIRALQFESVFSQRGIGGIADFSRIRCLHTWYAAHLVVPNTVGSLLDEWWQSRVDTQAPAI
tara:strand:- start:332646 stop:333161 length:516 start_codon:yes stop_codon:yes gene_type:complete